MKFVELHSCSAFSFLRGGSFPEQLAEVAAELESIESKLVKLNKDWEEVIDAAG